MKRRVRKIANFVAFNLLFFALYLNFIHKDKAASTEQIQQTKTAEFSGTVLIDNPAKYQETSSEKQLTEQKAELKPSVN
jgi:hypothetical protein